MRSYILVFALLAFLTPSSGLADAQFDCKNLKAPERLILACSEIIRSDPSAAWAFVRRGSAFAAKRDQKRAMADYNKAIGLDPYYAPSFLERGNLFLDQLNDLDRAKADYETVIRLNSPLAASAYHNRGLVFERRGRDDLAMGDYDNAIALNPKASFAYHSRGKLIERQFGNLHSAIAEYNKAAIIDARYTLECESRGFVFTSFPDGKSFDRAIERTPNDPTTYFNRGAKFQTIRKFGWAILDYDRAIEIDPNYALAYFNRATALRVWRGSEQALADYRMASKLDTNNFCYAWVFGLVSYRMAQYEEAATAFLRSVELKANAHSILLRYLARARLGHDATTELQTNADRLDTSELLFPVVNAYLGKATVEAALAAKTSEDAACSTAFYASQWYVLKGQNQSATKTLRTVLLRCDQEREAFFRNQAVSELQTALALQKK